MAERDESPKFDSGQAMAAAATTLAAEPAIDSGDSLRVTAGRSMKPSAVRMRRLRELRKQQRCVRSVVIDECRAVDWLIANRQLDPSMADDPAAQADALSRQIARWIESEKM